MNLVREAFFNELSSAAQVEKLIKDSGLNDEFPEEYPESLHPYMGKGWHIWQYPHQFANYLTFIKRFNIQSYLEIGVRHGGSFAFTCEYLKRFQVEKDFKAIGIDINITDKAKELVDSLNDKAIKLIECDSSTYAPEQPGCFDLIFIDGDHSYEGVKKDFQRFASLGKLIVLHDIVGCEGVIQFWNEIKHDYFTKEFTYQYPETGMSRMGIGVIYK